MDTLRRIRTMRGMNQVDLAKASGVAQNTISEIELGKREARPATLRKLARALDVEIADFFEEADRPKVSAPSSQQLTLNGELEEERRAEWDAAVRGARQLQEHGRARMDELLSAWRESKEHGQDANARRDYLDEIGNLLQDAYDIEMVLLGALYEPHIADQWPEVQAADRFYVDLFHLVQNAGLSIYTGSAQEREAAQAGQPAAHTVEESKAA